MEIRPEELDVLDEALKVGEASLMRAGDLFKRLLEHERTDGLYDVCEGACLSQSVELARLLDEIRLYMGVSDE